MQILLPVISLLNVILCTAGVFALMQFIANGIDFKLRLVIAPLLTFAIIAYLYYLLLILNISFTAFSFVFLLINIVHIWKSYQFITAGTPPVYGRRDYRSSILLLTAILLTAIIFVFNGSKYGGYDAWYIWNVHAKFLTDIPNWQRLFADKILIGHNDYPLLVSSVVAFLWNAFGNLSFVEPLLFSLFISVSILLLVYYGIIQQANNKTYALAAVLILVADHKFQVATSSQLADMPLSLFILLTIILWTLLRKKGQSNLTYIIGFTCASCPWMKNEGNIFFILFSIVFIVENFRDYRILGKYVAGIAVPLMVVVSFKVFFAPANDMVAGNQNNINQVISKLTNLDRYQTIIKFLTQMLLDNFSAGILLAAILCIFRLKAFKTAPFFLQLLVMGGYFVAYLLTPHDLSWHLTYSLDRLIFHLYPSFIFLGLSALAERYPLKIGESITR